MGYFVAILGQGQFYPLLMMGGKGRKEGKEKSDEK